MSDEPQPTYSAREIVLELFPATAEHLIPTSKLYALKAKPDGTLAICQLGIGELVSLTPIETSGHRHTQLCCDFCQHSAPRHQLQPYRLEVPGSGGRRFVYLILCADSAACDGRRLDDSAIRALLDKLAS